MAWTKLDVPYRGMDVESAPHELEKGYSREVENCLPGRPGRLPVRGALRAPFALRADKIPSAVWRLPNLALATYTPDQKMMTSDFTGTNSALSASAPDGEYPGPSHAKTGPNTIYGCGSRSFSLGTFKGKVLRWDGSSASVTVYSSSPTYAKACAYWLNRLWLLDPVKGAGGPTGRLVWSDSFANADLPDTVAAWQDDVSGLDNELVVAGLGEPMELCPIRAGLTVFSYDAIHLVRGSSPTSLTIRQEASGVGCVSQRAVVPWDDGVFFLDQQGFYYYDGVELIEVSERIRSEFYNRTSTLCSAARVDARTIGLTLVDNDSVEPFMFLYDVPSRSWSRFSSEALSITGGVYPYWLPSVGWDGGTEQGAPQILSTGGSWRTTDIAHDRTATYSITTQETDLAAVSAPMTASFKTRPLPVVQPDAKRDTQRVTVDYVSQADEAAAGGWTSTLKQAWDDTQIATAAVLRHDSSASFLRSVSELYAESDDAVVQMDYTGQNTDAESAGVEVHNVWVEHETAQRGASF